MSTFPTSIPSYLGFTAGHSLLIDVHASQHNLEQADIAAIATKVGTGASTPSAGTVLTASGSGTSSWSQVNLTTMVSGVLPVANGGTGVSSSTGTGSVVLSNNSTLVNPTLSNPTITNPTVAGYSALLALIFYVGFVMTETTGTNPGTTYGFGTWVAFGQGQVLIGNGTSDAAYAAGNTGGASTHNHPLSDNGGAAFNASVNVMTERRVTMPSWTATNNHAGTWTNAANAGSNTVAAGLLGNTDTVTQLPPYIVVYFWKRTA